MAGYHRTGTLSITGKIIAIINMPRSDLHVCIPARESVTFVATEVVWRFNSNIC